MGDRDAFSMVRDHMLQEQGVHLRACRLREQRQVRVHVWILRRRRDIAAPRQRLARAAEGRDLLSLRVLHSLGHRFDLRPRALLQFLVCHVDRLLVGRDDRVDELHVVRRDEGRDGGVCRRVLRADAASADLSYDGRSTHQAHQRDE